MPSSLNIGAKVISSIFNELAWASSILSVQSPLHNRISTFRFYVMRHWSRYGVNGALEMTFMNYEL